MEKNFMVRANDVIQALTCCITKKNCWDCPFTGENCEQLCKSCSLDIIKHLVEDNKKLTAHARLGRLKDTECKSLLNRAVRAESTLKQLQSTQRKIGKNMLSLPCDIGDTFYGIQGVSCDAYCARGFLYGKRKGTDDTILIVITSGGKQLVWGEEAFLTKEECEYLMNAHNSPPDTQ